MLQTVNVRLPPEQAQYTLEHAEAGVILCNTEFLGLLKAIRPKLRGVRKVICMADENTRATTLYTTGTTGLPKGVFFSHRQIVLHTLAELYALQLRPNDVYMPMTPLFHVHGWGMPYSATAAGLQQIYPGRYEPDLLVKLLKTEKVTVSHCVSTILKMILSSPAARDHDFAGWRVIIGGSALSKSLCQEAMSRGIDVNVAYGMSETCPILSISRLQRELVKKPEASTRRASASSTRKRCGKNKALRRRRNFRRTESHDDHHLEGRKARHAHQRFHGRAL